jgi:hypothetical protein
MGVNITINAMGTKEDVQKLWDALCEPNEYGGTSIRLDSNNIHPIKGTEFPVWQAKGETDKMHGLADKSKFKDLFTDLSKLSFYISIYLDDGKTVDWCWIGSNRHYDMIPAFVYNVWKTLEYVPETITKTKAMCLEAVKQDGGSLEFVPEEFKTMDMCLEAVKQDGQAFQLVPDKMKAQVEAIFNEYEFYQKWARRDVEESYDFIYEEDD